MENYNETKEKLREIFNKYDNHDISSDSNASTVERLKHVATIGFETSKIQSIIATFATENEFTPNEEVRNLIKKQRRHHPFLVMFNSPAIQATIAVDLIISLSNNYEICFNIFNMLTKLWIMEPNWLTDDKVTIGYLKFTKNICECLQLYRSVTNNNLGITDFMYDECDVLKPVELSVKLEKEKAMKHLQSIKPSEMDSLEKLKALQKPFESIRQSEVNYFQRIYNFLVNVMKLLTIRDSNVNIAPTDIIKIDLTALIGEIIFVNETSPSEVGEIIDNLNMNFVYVLCSNTIPLIDRCQTDDSDDLKNLIENTKNDNVHTNVRTENRRIFPINQEILTFIKNNNVLVAHLLQEYNSIKDRTVFYEQKYLENFMALEDIKTTAVLHENNLLVSALSYGKININKLGKYLEDTGNYR